MIGIIIFYASSIIGIIKDFLIIFINYGGHYYEY